VSAVEIIFLPMSPFDSTCYKSILSVGNDNSGKVAIWSMVPVRDEDAENDENVPKLICQMDNHLGLCCQFSLLREKNYILHRPRSIAGELIPCRPLIRRG